MKSPSSEGKRVAGIDPGNQGAFVFLGPLGPARVHMIPTKREPVGKVNRTMTDGTALRSLVSLLAGWEPHVIVVEHLWQRPTDTPMTAWGLSGGYHRILQCLTDNGLGYHLVAPLRWKNKILGAKENWLRDKEASTRYIQKEYPGWPLMIGNQRVPHDGIADAYCLALYGRDHL